MSILANNSNTGKSQFNQISFLSQALNSNISVRLIDGKVFEGRLVASDQFCLFLQPKNNATREPVLIYKHAIAYIALALEEK